MAYLLNTLRKRTVSQDCVPVYVALSALYVWDRLRKYHKYNVYRFYGQPDAAPTSPSPDTPYCIPDSRTAACHPVRSQCAPVQDVVVGALAVSSCTSSSFYLSTKSFTSIKLVKRYAHEKDSIGKATRIYLVVVRIVRIHFQHVSFGAVEGQRRRLDGRLTFDGVWGEFQEMMQRKRERVSGYMRKIFGHRRSDGWRWPRVHACAKSKQKC